MASKRTRLVEVEWADSYGAGGWMLPEEVAAFATQPHTCYTVGYVVARKKDRIVLAMNLGIGGTNHGHLMSIPRSQVRKIRGLST